MIAAAKNPRHKALVALGGLCGLRIAESLAVRVKDFTIKEGILPTLVVHGKGDKRRIIPVSEEAWRVITQAIVEAAVVSLDQKVINYEDRFARATITRLGQRAGLSRRVSSHDLRMTFATASYDKTLNIRATGHLLGHASTKTTEGYIGTRMETMRGAVDL